MKTKVMSFWQLSKGKTFQMEEETYSKKDLKHAVKCSDNTVVEVKEEQQVQVPEDYQI